MNLSKLSARPQVYCVDKTLAISSICLLYGKQGKLPKNVCFILMPCSPEQMIAYNYSTCIIAHVMSTFVIQKLTILYNLLKDNFWL